MILFSNEITKKYFDLLKNIAYTQVCFDCFSCGVLVWLFVGLLVFWGVVVFDFTTSSANLSELIQLMRGF